jgi:hypothetical protein
MQSDANRPNETAQLLRDYRNFVAELQHILYQHAAVSPELDIKIADLKRRACVLLGEPVECEVCEKANASIIRVEVSDGEGPSRWLSVCGDACLQAVVLRWRQICEVIRPEAIP